MVEERVARPEQGELFLPPGFRFHPTDEEVITSYLLHKMLNPSSFAPRAIGEVNLNKCEPWDLPSRAKMAGEKVDEWYFFCHKDMKYPTGMRTNRATKAGYWKATGKDREIFKDPASAAGSGGREVVGMKKTLVFYMGRAPRGSKTNWVMHEFRLDGKYRDSRTNQLRLISPKDEWVVCKVFHKNNGEEGNNKKAAAAVDSSVGTTPDVSSISVDDATGGDGDGFFLDSMIDDPSVYFFNSTATSLPDTTTTAMNNNAGHPPTGSYTLHDHQAKALGLAGDIISPDFGVVNLPSSSAASTAGISQQINSLRRRNYYGGSYATNYYLKSDAKNLGV